MCHSISATAYWFLTCVHTVREAGGIHRGAETNMDSYAFKGLEDRGKITGTPIFCIIKLTVVVQDLFGPYDAYRKTSHFTLALYICVFLAL